MKLLSVAFLICYLKFTNAIYNGHVAKPGQFPWVVQTFPPAGCTSSIFHTNGFVISAAHCLPSPVNGRVCRSLQNRADVNCEYFLAQNVHHHPNWHQKHIPLEQRDVVIIRLNRFFGPLMGFAPIPLLTRPIQHLDPIVIAGFGSVGVGQPTTVLRHANFHVVNIHPTFVVASSSWSTTMPGDSGAGYTTVVSNTPQLVAIHCCGAGIPMGTFGGTLLLPILPWINTILGTSFLPQQPPPRPPGGCNKPTCPINFGVTYPTTNGIGVYQCVNNVAVTTLCPSGQFFTRRGCRRPPIDPSDTFPCQEFPFGIVSQ